MKTVKVAYSFGCIDREGVAIYKTMKTADECHLRQGPENDTPFGPCPYLLEHPSHNRKADTTHRKWPTSQISSSTNYSFRNRRCL
jgi:hypothetical protein